MGRNNVAHQAWRHTAGGCRASMARSLSKLAAVAAIATGVTAAGVGTAGASDATATASAPGAGTTAGTDPVATAPGTVSLAEYERMREIAQKHRQRSNSLARHLTAQRRRGHRLARKLRVAKRSVRIARSAHSDPVMKRVAMWARLAHCETRGRWSLASGNGFHGGLQFHPRTWRAYGGGMFAAYAHRATPIEQLAVGEQVLKRQGRGAWPHCGSVAGL